MKYPFEEIEKKWQNYWEEKKVYKTNLLDSSNKLYCLVMLPYPSAAKMHIGHWYNYGPTDSWARFKKLNGYNVFEPMGYDAFGLPAENYAIKTGIHPQDSTLKNIADIREMLKRMGGMYDWDAELMTCVPEYYKWNQWLFLQLYKRGLAYRKNAPVNWCPNDQTVLAREQVLSDGTCERCGTVVIQKNLTQWFFKITDYAEELLEYLDKIDWPEKTKVMQQNWIGKSIGAEVKFKVDGSDDVIYIFTTRPDTLFGATYMVLAPEHPLVEKITTDEHRKEVEEYVESIKTMTEIDRTSTVKEKTGVPTGAFAVNPVNGKKIPIWIADYVLMTYGTGAIMAVPGEDERDWEFAVKFNLPIIRTVKPPENFEGGAYTGDGPAINSDFLDGLYVEDAKKKIISWLEEKGIGKKTVNYRLRDWLISRQRYWGTPIPIIYCENCGEVPVPEDQLPVILPYEVDFKPEGGSPLASKEDFVNTTCPKCGAKAKRDVDTMDTFVDSSWYFLRYLNPNFNDGMFDVDLANKWTPVDVYVGGAEHAVMHLLYARFIYKFLRDIGLVKGDEPFLRLIHQGTITNMGAKMSKSKGNVVDPNDFLVQYGSDVFRMYLMFMGPYELGGDWSDQGIVGVDRFVQRIYSLFEQKKNIAAENPAKEEYNLFSLNEAEKNIYRKVNQTLKKFETEIENFRFNTAVAALMELLNEFKNIDLCSKEIQTYALERFALMISPLAPHLGEECWQLIGKEKSIFENPQWFKADEDALTVESVTLAIQINGKLRAKLEMPVDLSESEVKKIVFNDKKVKSYVDGKQIIKEIYVPNKIYNIVVK
ncbi:leucine--tRNA ligase [Melioribacteraceae bacterium 4301-Me]|uniref:leucine--tRNA ligase n=1 Tax=Pyranulibacter aquaticus TaxID=3163344 RepID=UPI003597079A